MPRRQDGEHLVELVRGGSGPAFDEIVARYRPPLLRYCGHFLSETRAHDAVQLTFLKAYAAIHSGATASDLNAWLYRIAHNACIDILREDSSAHQQLAASQTGVEGPYETVERKERLRDVLAAVEALPARQRSALLLRELDGRSYDDIAAELGLGRGAVRQLLYRARSTLRSRVPALVPPQVVAGIRELSHVTAPRISELCGHGGTTALGKACAAAGALGIVFGGALSDPPVPRSLRNGQAIASVPECDNRPYGGAGRAAGVPPHTLVARVGRERGGTVRVRVLVRRPAVSGRGGAGRFDDGGAVSRPDERNGFGETQLPGGAPLDEASDASGEAAGGRESARDQSGPDAGAVAGGDEPVEAVDPEDDGGRDDERGSIATDSDGDDERPEAPGVESDSAAEDLNANEDAESPGA